MIDRTTLLKSTDVRGFAILGYCDIRGMRPITKDVCPEVSDPVWDNNQLCCKLTKLQRMREAGVFGWLFQ